MKNVIAVNHFLRERFSESNVDFHRGAVQSVNAVLGISWRSSLD